MKTVLRHYIVDTFCLYLVSTLFSGIIFENGLITLLLTGVGLTIATLLIKPLINILLLPINLITFGVFKWISSAIALFLVTLVVPGFKIVAFIYPGLTTLWFDIPQINLAGILAIIAFSLIISFFGSLMYWLMKS